MGLGVAVALYPKIDALLIKVLIVAFINIMFLYVCPRVFTIEWVAVNPKFGPTISDEMKLKFSKI